MSSQFLTLILYMVASRLLVACLVCKEQGACLGVHLGQQKQLGSGRTSQEGTPWGRERCQCNSTIRTAADLIDGR
ncbi:hypothetical protein B0T09DRAFT_345452 [Sordaria sp. MPI-SDFR-AT-0083]|nr:hypothetical protein B0T09DRAFT_345452 [Sordaria sp. MPI-SDFR-AT-0083]